MLKAHYKSINLEVESFKTRVLDGEKTNQRQFWSSDLSTMKEAILKEIFIVIP